MFLSALLLVAAIEAGPPPMTLGPAVAAARHRDLPCRQAGLAWAKSPATGGARPLGEAPPAKAHYAVARSIGGCPVAAPLKTRQIDLPR